MRCPNCDAKIKNGMPACVKCGTKVSAITNASHLKARQVLKNGTLLEKEKIFNTFNTPKELSRKTLFWLTLFFGVMGAQDFYVGKTKWGISKILSFTAGNIIVLLCYYGYAISFYTIGGLLVAYPVLTWIFDIIRVIFKRYPFPVMIED